MRLGAISKYLPPALLRGFTTGAACHVIVTQLTSLLGLTIQSSNKKPKTFKLIMVGFYQMANN